MPKLSQKAKKELQTEVISILSKEYPEVKIQLNHSSPFELLIATMLSAQCTDARVNIVTEKLFKKYLVADDYLKVPAEELEQDIFSTGYYKAKARNIRECAKVLIERFNREIPNNLEDLVALPGVGRKTANVVLGHAFGIPGVVVDTHVVKISNRIGIVNTKDAVKIEQELMKLIPKEQWTIFTHYYIEHGRKVCVARSPKCKVCLIRHLCNYGKENA
jgi:endonuclease-3